MIKRDPYKYIKFVKGRPKERQFLSRDELKKIENCVPQKSWSAKMKWIAIVISYTGVAYADLMSVNWKSYVEVNGKKCIMNHHRKKTGILEPIIISDIVYNALENINWEIPKWSNHEMNCFLKDLLDDCDIRKPLTLHGLRHTFCTLMLYNGVDLYTTSKLMGHASINQTQKYLHPTDKDLINGYTIFENAMSIK